MNAEYRIVPNRPPTARRPWSHTGVIELPVIHDGRRQDTTLTIRASVQQLRAIRDAIDAALLPDKDELIDEIIQQYRADLADDLEEKVEKRAEELEAMSAEELQQLRDTLTGEKKG